MGLFIDILKTLFPNITDENVDFAQNHIQAELINGRTKGIPIIRLALSYAYEIILKKDKIIRFNSNIKNHIRILFPVK
jgi:hypothetical protein